MQANLHERQGQDQQQQRRAVGVRVESIWIYLQSLIHDGAAKRVGHDREVAAQHRPRENYPSEARIDVEDPAGVAGRDIDWRLSERRVTGGVDEADRHQLLYEAVDIECLAAFRRKLRADHGRTLPGTQHVEYPYSHLGKLVEIAELALPTRYESSSFCTESGMTVYVRASWLGISNSFFCSMVDRKERVNGSTASRRAACSSSLPCSSPRGHGTEPPRQPA